MNIVSVISTINEMQADGVIDRYGIGMPCATYHQLPAAYYLAARFPDDFESAVLRAQSGTRAMSTVPSDA